MADPGDFEDSGRAIDVTINVPGGVAPLGVAALGVDSGIPTVTGIEGATLDFTGGFPNGLSISNPAGFPAITILGPMGITVHIRESSHTILHDSYPITVPRDQTPPPYRGVPPPRAENIEEQPDVLAAFFQEDPDVKGPVASGFALTLNFPLEQEFAASFGPVGPPTGPAIGNNTGGVGNVSTPGFPEGTPADVDAAAGGAAASGGTVGNG